VCVRISVLIDALRLAHNRTVVLLHDAYAGAKMNRRPHRFLWEAGYFHRVQRRESLAVLRPTALGLERAAAGDRNGQFEQDFARWLAVAA
jgi:hypothetical protein